MLVYLMGDLLVVRFHDALAEAKQPLAELLPAEKHQDILEDLEAMHNHLIEITRPSIAAIVEKVTGIEVVAAQHELNATTGEKVFFFTLARSPDCLQ